MFFQVTQKNSTDDFFLFLSGLLPRVQKPTAHYIRYLLDKFIFELIAPSSTFHLELEIFKYIESHHSNRIVNILLNFSMSVGVATTKLNYRI